MKKYFTQINDSDKQNEIQITEGGKAFINGAEYEFDNKTINDNAMMLRINNKNYFILVSENEDDESIEINLDSALYKVKCKSDIDLLIEGMSGNKSKSSVKKEIKSPMPGIIKVMNVKTGQHVDKGDVMLVLEAMKMENEIKAAGEGTIKKINVDVMSSVEKNELLLEFE